MIPGLMLASHYTIKIHVPTPTSFVALIDAAFQETSNPPITTGNDPQQR